MNPRRPEIGKLVSVLAKTMILVSLLLLPLHKDIPPSVHVNEPKSVLRLEDIGHKFFHDKSLSRTGMLSCASCHRPDLFYQDGLERAVVGSNFLSRNTPSILNINRYNSFFWDGRAKSIREQLDGPLFSRIELNTNLTLIKRSIKNDSEIAGFFNAWKIKNPSSDEIEFLKRALEMFMTKVTTKQTKLDVYSKNQLELPHEAKKGMDLFFGKAGCVSCHPPPNFTDNQFHDTGLYRRRIIYQTIHIEGRVEDDVTSDKGVGDIIGGTENMFRFRTASLVNASNTAPYMHDGSLPTLEAVIDFYDRGGDTKSPKRKPLGLTRAEKSALIAFLELLSDAQLP